MNRRARLPEILLVLLVLLSSSSRPAGAQEGRSQVSKPGQYEGYSQPVYEQWVRSSQYLTMRDGFKLAVDIFRPARNGEPVSESLPVIWTYERYQRASVRDGRVITKLDKEPWLQVVLKHGYVIGVVDARGSGASEGRWDGPFAPQEAADAYDITEWFAAQPWSSKRVGMYGRSYMGTAQFLAASTAPPHLKAIFPEMALGDLYSSVYPGGIFREEFAQHWGGLIKNLDAARPPAPVENDVDGSLLSQAVAGHTSNRDFFDLCSALEFRNSVDAATNNQFYLTREPFNYLDKIKGSGVAVYQLAGWYDLWPRDALVWFTNLKNPQKLVIGPWAHTRSEGFDLAAEHLRWYDYWLKEIKNGIREEAPIYYYTMGSPTGQEWHTAWQWPLPNEKPTRYYFQGGRSGSVNSINDGLLADRQLADASPVDTYEVNYETTSGRASRWTNAYGGPFSYPGLRANDEKSLTYTTPPLVSDVEVTGHPVVHLWTTSTATDGDLFAYLLDVPEDGNSQYVTEGALRASHRALSTPSFNYLQLPYHRSFKEDVAALTSEPVELVFDLYPTSNLFRAGHRIRVTIAGADRDNATTPELSPAPTISLYRAGQHSSYIVLPIVPTTTTAAAIVTPPLKSHSASGLIFKPTVILLLAALGVSLVVVVLFTTKRAGGKRAKAWRGKSKL